MSKIDTYQHKQLGFIHCNSAYDFVHNSSTRKIAVYKLLEDIPPGESDFDGKAGDILVGGGSGEAPAFRISYPNALKFFTEAEFDDFNDYHELFKPFWSPTEAFKLCDGFQKSGWNPDEPIEIWLAKQICCLLMQHIPDYSNFLAPELTVNLEFEKTM